MCPLLSEEKRSLLRIARKSIELALTGGRAQDSLAITGSLAQRRGAFVTLHHRGRLRGCIGRVMVLEPLYRVVAECAVSAAMDDPRFPPLKLEDLDELEIEISMLSAPQQVRDDEVYPGIHGLIVSREMRRGVLLPQVAAQHGWSRERFLEQTCYKAGLEGNAWRNPETRIEVFTAEVFSEAEFKTMPENGTANASPYSNSQ